MRSASATPGNNSKLLGLVNVAEINIDGYRPDQGKSLYSWENSLLSTMPHKICPMVMCTS